MKKIVRSPTYVIQKIENGAYQVKVKLVNIGIKPDEKYVSDCDFPKQNPYVGSQLSLFLMRGEIKNEGNNRNE